MEKGWVNQVSLPFPPVGVLSVIVSFFFMLHPLIHLDIPDELHRVFDLYLKITVHQLIFVGGDTGGIHELKVTLGGRVTIVNFNTLLLGLRDQWLYLHGFAFIIPKDWEGTNDEANTKNYLEKEWTSSFFSFLRIANYNTVARARLFCLGKRFLKLVIRTLVYRQCWWVIHQ